MTDAKSATCAHDVTRPDVSAEVHDALRARVKELERALQAAQRLLLRAEPLAELDAPTLYRDILAWRIPNA
ncbi:MAG: hypothetical protein IT518_20075 [Burkholderiales bacterium]|nr:hypothetical protein [Burkholderiales bacterium]